MEAIRLLETGKITEISLDHDLGDERENGTGYFVAKWIEVAAHNAWIPRLKWTVHTANPAGGRNIEHALLSADRSWDRQQGTG